GGVAQARPGRELERQGGVAAAADPAGATGRSARRSAAGRRLVLARGLVDLGLSLGGGGLVLVVLELLLIQVDLLLFLGRERSVRRVGRVEGLGRTGPGDRAGPRAGRRLQAG